MLRLNVDKSPRLDSCVKNFIKRNVIPFTAVGPPDTSRRGKIICSDTHIEALVLALGREGIYVEEYVELRFVGVYDASGAQREFVCIYLEASDGEGLLRLGESAAGDFPPDRLNRMNDALEKLPFAPPS